MLLGVFWLFYRRRASKTRFFLVPTGVNEIVLHASSDEETVFRSSFDFVVLLINPLRINSRHIDKINKCSRTFQPQLCNYLTYCSISTVFFINIEKLTKNHQENLKILFKAYSWTVENHSNPVTYCSVQNFTI